MHVCCLLMRTIGLCVQTDRSPCRMDSAATCCNSSARPEAVVEAGNASSAPSTAATSSSPQGVCGFDSEAASSATKGQSEHSAIGEEKEAAEASLPALPLSAAGAETS